MEDLINNETRMLLKITRHRALAMYHRLLLHLPETREQYLSAVSSSPNALGAIGDLVFSNAQRPDLLLALATPLTAEFASIFWTEMGERVYPDFLRLISANMPRLAKGLAA